MNKTLDKIISNTKQALAKPAAKLMIPLAIALGGYQGANAQTVGSERDKLYAPVQSGNITVVVEDEKSETLNVSEKVGYGSYARYDKATRHLDILKVFHPSSGHHYSLIYPGDLSWNKGDTLKLETDYHEKRSAKGLSSWTDYELTEHYLGETQVNAVTPARKRYHHAVITDILDVIHGKQD